MINRRIIEYIFRLIDFLIFFCPRLRYRAQRVFQLQSGPAMRLSVIGERTVLKLLVSELTNEHTKRIEVYMRAFFAALVWDCPHAYENILNEITRFRFVNPSAEKIHFLDKICLIDASTWARLVKLVKDSTDPSNLEELLISTMGLVKNRQISASDWSRFAHVLMAKNVNSLKYQLFVAKDRLELIRFFTEHVQFLTEYQSKKPVRNYYRLTKISYKLVSFGNVEAL